MTESKRGSAKDWGDVKFLHYRNYTGDTVQPNGGATIAYVVHDDGLIRWATAKCNAQDRYNKAYGRQKAAGRLLSRTLSMAFATDLPKFIQDMDDLASFDKLHRRKRK